uniref:Uncharacterized protein n=1 Tax=Meloidogyne enterolobii TaxID=390850 RepID=A0A6V7TTE0_MELEN|nr:unnamed protein product [Meloidogyne enterolobii]
MLPEERFKHAVSDGEGGDISKLQSASGCQRVFQLLLVHFWRKRKP